MGQNRYGVDVSYFYNIIKRELTDLSSHTPDELARVLARMSRTADKSVMLEPEFNEELTATKAINQELAEAMTGVTAERDGLKKEIEGYKALIDDLEIPRPDVF